LSQVVVMLLSIRVNRERASRGRMERGCRHQERIKASRHAMTRRLRYTPGVALDPP